MISTLRFLFLLVGLLGLAGSHVMAADLVTDQEKAAAKGTTPMPSSNTSAPPGLASQVPSPPASPNDPNPASPINPPGGSSAVTENTVTHEANEPQVVRESPPPTDASASASPADAGMGALPTTSGAMVEFFQLMEKKGVLSKDESAHLIKKAQTEAATAAAAKKAAAPAPDAEDETTTVTYVPKAVRDQMREEIKQDVMDQAREENWADPRQFPSWLSRIGFFGDVRVRVQDDLYPSGNATGPGSNFWNFNAINTGSPYDINFGGTNAARAPTWNNDQDRFLTRLRVRFGANSDLGDGFTTGFRIATGSDNQPVSENQSLGYANNGQGGDFSKYAIWLDRGFIKWQLPHDLSKPPGLDFSVSLGRFDNPFFAPTRIVWEDDIGFDGIAFKAKYPINTGLNVFANAGAFPVFNTDLNFSTTSPTKYASEDKYMFGGQVGTEFKINEDLNMKIAGAYYYFENIEGKVSDPFTPLTSSDQGDTDDSRPSFAQRGNTYIALRDIVPPAGTTLATYNQWQYFGLATPFHEVDVSTRLDYSHFDPFHIWLIGEGVENVAFNRNAILNNGPNDPNGTQLVGPVNNLGNDGVFGGGNIAWIVSLNLGSPSLEKLWDWNLAASYRYVESDSVVDGFCDSDFGGGGTNMKGWVLGGNLALSSQVWLGLRWMSANAIAGPTYGEDLVQFDVNAKF